ncbi:MAG: adenylate/guanylate cyclase domain-containing protein, partial [Acidimicrobiales bacterium]
LSRAIELARAHGDVRRWGEALIPLLRFRIGHTNSPGDAVDGSLARAFLEEAGSGHADLRAMVLALLAEAAFAALDHEAARGWAEQAAALIAQVDDPWVTSLVEFAVGLAAFGNLDLEVARLAFDRSTASAELSNEVWRQRTALGRLPMVSSLLGDLPLAVVQAEHARLHNEEWNLRGEECISQSVLTSLAAAQSRLADVERHGREATQLLHRTGYSFASPIFQPAMGAARMLRGDVAGAHEVLDAWEASGGGGGLFRYRQLVDAWSGSSEVVRKAIADRPWPVVSPGADPFVITSAALQIEVAAALGDSAMAQLAVATLTDAWHKGVRWTLGWPALIPRLLGVAASLAQDSASADSWFEQARVLATAAEAPGEAARVDLDRATMLLADPHGDTTVARGLAERSAAVFDELGMLTLLVQARRLGSHQGSSEAGRTSGSAPTAALRVVLYSDIVDSTALNLRAGDVEYVKLLREHDRLVRDRLRRHDGVEFKHTGDGVCAWFGSPAAAVECGLAIHDDLDRFSALNPELPIRLRIGLAAGEPIEADGDLFGLTVVAAARICAAAPSGGVLVADEIPRLVRGTRLRFAEVGEVTLKGFPEPFRLHEALAPA